ncbi:hypothetical protein MVEN_00265900 [Mycena venus]|uniref:Uncharacterized protein n=1 Tax=Mycena venus TaxID=2733690 RepID=A0A8H7DEN6_9AGAR|nr:hypothetical protein MVEN_00265900 [Mycena venus]
MSTGMRSGTSLLERCVGFLHDSTLDLRTCSLVNRAWVYPAQSHIFSEIVLGISGADQDNRMRVSRLLEILEAAPHLVGFISTLRVNAEIAGLGNFLRICSLPFTCLRILYIAGGSNLSPQACFGIRGLLSFPTIESFSIFCRFTNTDNFLRIWELCSANLKHLLLGTSISDMQTPTCAEGFAVHHRIALYSLELGYGFPSNLEWWLDDSRCPFDFSGLKALRITRDTGVIRRSVLGPALKTIKLVAADVFETVDLSSFERLTEVATTIFGPDHTQAFETISTIHGSSRPLVRAIRFHLLPSPILDLDTCLQIDRGISEIREHFSNLTITNIFPLWDHKISLQWNFLPASGPMWYTTIT